MQKETARETRVIYSRLEYLNVSTFSRQMDFSLSAFMLSTVPSAPPKVPSVILPTVRRGPCGHYFWTKAGMMRCGRFFSMSPMPLLWEVMTATRSSSGNMKMNCPPAPRPWKLW